MAEKVERSPLKFFFNCLKIMALTVFILYVLLAGKCAYQVESESSDGKAWCESVIHEYDEGRDEFLEKHSNSLRDDGILSLDPSPENKYAKAHFTVWSNGEYECRYSITVGLGDTYSYNSKTQEWRNW